MLLSNLFDNYRDIIKTEIEVNGWVKTCRSQKQMLFIHISDGSSQSTLQIIATANKIENFDEISKITTGTSLNVKGLLVESPAKGQLVELNANFIKLYQICPTTFPLQKVGLPLEFLRTVSHLRHRSNIIRATFKIRSETEYLINSFFHSNDFCLVDIPMLTTNACEGGCQPLQVTSLLDSGLISNIPTELINPNKIDFHKDFFGNPVYLTVSNQLHLECFAHGLNQVYTMTQATRGEPSVSTKHLANFSMLEWEFCFGDLNKNIDIAENLIKYIIAGVLQYCSAEIKVLNAVSNELLIPKLQNLVNEPFKRMKHIEAISFLRGANQIEPFIEEPKFDGDLSGEHERYLVKHFGCPVIVTNYPKKVKAFYMPVCEIVNAIEYVDCYDLLMDIGEVVGGSQRIWSEVELLGRMSESNIDPDHLSWYVDLRRFGSVPHGGAGLGIERLVAVITGMLNIKDCVTFPLTIHHCTH